MDGATAEDCDIFIQKEQAKGNGIALKKLVEKEKWIISGFNFRRNAFMNFAIGTSCRLFLKKLPV
jgi:hypothetical protein